VGASASAGMGAIGKRLKIYNGRENGVSNDSLITC
jgi:hypothetical protein